MQNETSSFCLTPGSLPAAGLPASALVVWSPAALSHSLSHRHALRGSRNLGGEPVHKNELPWGRRCQDQQGWKVASCFTILRKLRGRLLLVTWRGCLRGPWLNTCEWQVLLQSIAVALKMW